MKIKVISEDDFLEMIRMRPAGKGLASPAVKKGTPRSSLKTKIIKEEDNIEIKQEKTSPAKTSHRSVDAKPAAAKKLIHVDPVSRKAAEPSQAKKNASEDGSDADVPWVEKYKPANVKQIIGKLKHSTNYLFYWT